MGRSFQYFCLMMWKNMHVVKNNRFQFTVSLILPFLLSLIAVGLRVTDIVEFSGPVFYARLNMEQTFARIVTLINQRRQVLEDHYQKPYHSKYCPNLIIAMSMGNFSKYAHFYNEVVTATQKYEVEVISFDNCTHLKEKMMKQHYLYGICFKNVESNPYSLSYEFIVPNEQRDYDRSYISYSWLPNSNLHLQVDPHHQVLFATGGGPGAVREGLIYLQNRIAIAHMRRFYPDFEYDRIRLSRTETLIGRYDPVLKDRITALTNIILMGYLFPTVFIVTLIVTEKESGIRNFMKARGVFLPIQLLAWCIILFLMTAFCSLITTIIFKIQWKGGLAILPHTSFVCLFVFLLGYCAANTSFCVMASAVCSSRHKAIIFLTFCWLMGFLTYLHNLYNNPFSYYHGFFLFLVPNALTANIFHQFCRLEQTNYKTSLKDLFDFKDISIGFLTLLFSAIVFFFAAWGLDRVKPGLYGKHMRLPKSCRKTSNTESQKDLLYKTFMARQIAMKNPSPTVHERQPSSFNENKFHIFTEPVINVINLTKSFNKRELFSNFYLSLYPDEVVVCVGANRSGKTVLALMLCGLLPFDSGLVHINNIDLVRFQKEALDDVAFSLGTHFLIPDLTLFEQVVFYSKLYGIKYQHAFNNAENLINELDMGSHRDVLTRKLSTISKNILAIMCAFSGNKHIIILDSFDSVFEGPKGRPLSKFILQKKTKKTIFITSCASKLAESLASRTVILQEGAIAANGKARQLKEAYTSNIVLSCYRNYQLNADLYMQIVKRHIPSVRNENSDLSREIKFIISDQEEREVPGLLEELEARKEELGLDVFSVRHTDLSDVFRAINEQMISNVIDEEDFEKATLKFSTQNTTSPIKKTKSTNYYQKVMGLNFLQKIELLKGRKLLCSRVQALLRKQFYAYTVNKLTLTFFLLMPLLICICAQIILLFYKRNVIVQPRPMELERYSMALTLISSARRLKMKNRDIILAYEKYWAQQKNSNFQVVDLMSEHVMDYMQRDPNLGIKLNYYLFGLHVGHTGITAKFNCLYLHTSQTSLALVHNAVFTALLNDGSPRISVALSPLPPTLGVIETELNVMRFLSFCLSLGLWFAFGLSTTGIMMDRKAFSTGQHSKGLLGSVFWIGYLLTTLIKLAIVLPIIIVFLLASEYRILMTPRLIGAIILIMTLGALYFQLFKLTASILFYEIEKKYMITIFLTIVSIITFNFSYINYTSDATIRLYLIFLPLNIISQLLFYAFHIETIHKMCELSEIYDISVYVEKCRLKPNCCDEGDHFAALLSYISYLFVAIMLVFCISWIASKIILLKRLYSFKKIPLHKPIENLRKVDSTDNAQPDPQPSHRLRSKFSTFDPKTETLDKLPIFVADVGKRVHNQDIVDDVRFLVRRGDCFCLIGPPEDDKQMLLRLIAGDIRPSYGQIFHYGEPAIPKFPWKRKISFGFCLPDLGRVHFFEVGHYMEIYAMSVGVPRRQVFDVCSNLASYFDIMEDYGKLIAVVCTSTKLKMAFALAFIGCPQISIIDINLYEIDYSGKDLMMQLVHWHLRNQSTVILSVHQPTAAIAFGTRLGIFVNCKMRAIGSVGTICEKLADGFLVVSRVEVKDAAAGRVKISVNKLNANASIIYCSFIEAHFTKAILKEQVDTVIYYFIPYESTTFKKIYLLLKQNKDMLNIVEYKITQNTIEIIMDKIIADSFSQE